MDKVIMCFPGQGSQQPNMAIDLYNYSSKVKNLFQIASDISHLDLHKILIEGDLNILKQTEISQNVIVLASLSAYVLLKDKGINPTITAGFSLGELMALRASEVIDDEMLFKLVNKRSSLMAQSSKDATDLYGEMAMAAIINLDKVSVTNIINKKTYKNIFIANDNTKNQVVISGVKEEIEKLIPSLKENGARRVIMLKVSGPFHTPLLKQAEIKFEEYLRPIKFKNPTTLIYSNVTGKLEKDMKPFVPRQITNQVQWLSIMKDISSKFENFNIYEVGVSKTLSNFFKSENLICRSCGTLDQIKGL